MVKIVVLYGPPTDPQAFEEYYATTHAALVAKIPNLQRFEAGRRWAPLTAASRPSTGSRSCGSTAGSDQPAAYRVQ
jgi:uncharacterized protein (TIGR02118 family)